TRKPCRMAPGPARPPRSRRRRTSRAPPRREFMEAPDPGEVAAALRAAGVREVDISIRRRAEYSTDASLYRVVPAAVAFPRSADDAEAALAACRTLGVPLTARGAGTSIAGNAVGPGVVLDFSRYLSGVRDIDPDAATATVDPGAVLDDLQRAAAPHGLRFGPDPSSHSRCTCGAARTRPRPRCSPRWIRSPRPTWPCCAASSAGFPGRCRATRWSTCCPSADSTCRPR